MTDQPRSALQALLKRMRSDGPRWNARNHTFEVVDARDVDEWANELEAVLASWPPDPPPECDKLPSALE